MGRQAKLKRQRQQAKQNPVTELSQPSEDSEPKTFVQELEQQGYRLQETQSSPEIPKKDINPQI